MPVVRAYDPSKTHPHMSRESARLLDITPKYRGVMSANDIEDLARGSTLEDGFIGERGMFHFYNPYTELGLHFLGTQPSAIETATLITRRDANPDTVTKWVRTLSSYFEFLGSGSSSKRQEAYRSLGTILHLLSQDI